MGEDGERGGVVSSCSQIPEKELSVIESIDIVSVSSDQFEF